ncbi:MAG: UDP-N-acetylmuramate--L-alanine ligase [Patescibacteria group bacterium]
MRIHFIGIGGIGVSALAQYYLAKGHEISGSDLESSEITEFLDKKGIKVFIGQKPENVSADLDLIIYSPAVPQDNPEFKKAKELGVRMKSYPGALGELTEQHYTIAVSGSHGKSTTTAMVGLILERAGFDPTVIVGTKLKEFGNFNFRAGKSKYLVIEACEYDGSFLNYSPQIIVVTNVDKEHLDYFKTFSNVKKAFKKFMMRLPAGGFLVANKEDENMPKITNNQFSSFYYATNQKEADVLRKVLKIPGMHNISNALAALAVARILKVPDDISFKTLGKYKGSWRRFEIIKNKPYTIISDYAHHPNEILATLTAAREKYPNKKIWCVFQPHQHQRTHYLFNDFVKVFRRLPIDNIIITDIYDVAGRETKKINEEVNSQKLAKKINKKSVLYMNVEKAEKFVKENIKKGELLIIMGAGDIYKLTAKF